MGIKGNTTKSEIDDQALQSILDTIGFGEEEDDEIGFQETEIGEREDGIDQHISLNLGEDNESYESDESSNLELDDGDEYDYGNSEEDDVDLDSLLRSISMDEKESNEKQTDLEEETLEETVNPEEDSDDSTLRDLLEGIDSDEKSAKDSFKDRKSVV